jgi:hypothetical protein
LQVLCAVAQTASNARHLNLGRMRNASSCAANGFRHFHLFLSRAAWRGLAAVDRHAGRRCHWLSGDFMLIVIGSGVLTLFATGGLFVMQILEDCRDA